MGKNEGSESRFLTGFLMGCFVGVLVALGIGASLGAYRGWHEQTRVDRLLAEYSVFMEETSKAKKEAREAKAELEKLRGAKKPEAEDQQPEPDVEKDG